jgi:hypothetical protein
LSTEISKSNENAAFMQARLAEVEMNGTMRLQAEAQIARAEAMIDFVSTLVAGVDRLLRKLVLRPVRKLAATVG